MTYYARVSYYDEPSEIAEFDTLEEAAESYALTLDLASHNVMGDIAGASYGKHLPNGKREVYASKQFT